MKVFDYAFLGAAIAIAPMSIHAQTTTFALGQAFCAPGAPIYCYSVPMSNGNPADDSTAWFDISPAADPISSRFIAIHNGPLQGTAHINVSSNYAVTMTTVTYTLNGRTYGPIQVPQSVQFTCHGTTVSGQSYTCAGVIVLGHWTYSSGGGGRGGGGAGWHYSAVGGSLTVQMN